MSSIDAIEATSEYAPMQQERFNDDIDASQAMATENTEVPKVQAASEQQDKKTTVNGFQYTGKGSFIDGVF